jgi:ribulose-phosphate 3-epimerase
MISIAPTITAETPEAYTLQLQSVVPFARRIHIDLMDGKFAPTTSIRPDQMWWPGNVRVDLHVMYKKPFEYTDLFVALGPQMVIVHAESTGNFAEFADTLHRHGIETGVALLPETPVANIAPALELIDHVLIFSGNLGHQGGSKADPNLLPKIAELRELKPTLEIGWDGGINARNASALVKYGVEVLNVGGYMHVGDSPKHQYEQLQRSLYTRHK